MSSVFDIKEHVISSSHIREYSRGTSHTQEDVLKIAIKQYIPRDNPNPTPGDVTIIGAHANAFPMELYEPLWLEILARSNSNGFKIRSIWIADVAHQGASGVLNEHLLGNDPSYIDHARDLLHMINHFRAQMPMPIVGIGHSMGGNNLVNLALMHPRLLTTLILMDPVIQSFEGLGPPGTQLTAEAMLRFELLGRTPAQLSTYRRDLWPSRKDAAEAFRKTKFYQKWDSRVLDNWIKYGLRDTPTPLYPNEKGSVTLATTKHQEVFSFIRPTVTKGETTRDLPSEFQDMPLPPFYRSEFSSTMKRLPNLRPSTFYIFGGTSGMSTPALQEVKLRNTGTGMGGSGGMKDGRVRSVTLDGIGHLVAMEAVKECADAAAPWLGQEVERWRQEAAVYEAWAKKDQLSKMTISEEQKAVIGSGRKAKI